MADVMRRCTPDMQPDFLADPIQAFRSRYPTLKMLDEAYGGEASKSWLYAEIVNLNEFCGCAGKMSDEQIYEIARLVTATYPYLKLSELLLFFGWLKIGRYGRFYGNIDPMIITQALLDFGKDRNMMYARLQDEAAERRRVEILARPGMTEEEYRSTKAAGVASV